MFAGIGGFRAGLTRAGGFQCVGHCEIDKYADASYRAIHDIGKEELYYPDATKIDPTSLPDFDLICGGFPCRVVASSISLAPPQAAGLIHSAAPPFQIAAALLGCDLVPIFMPSRSPTKWVRLGEEEQGSGVRATNGSPKHSGLCDDEGYHVEWMVLNSKDFGVPQSRKRVFIICYLDPRCAGKILPVPETAEQALVQLVDGPQGSRIYDSEGIACTQTAGAGGMGGKTGLYFVDLCKGNPVITTEARCLTAKQDGSLTNFKGQSSGVLYIKEATKRGFKEALPGDSVNLGYAGSNTRRGRVGHDIAHTLETSCAQGIVERGGRVRRLMPRECLRLQGFTDDQIDKILAITSDAQAYKQAGNSVTVNVIEAIGRNLRAVHEELQVNTE